MDKPLVEMPTDITPRVVITPDFTGATDEEREQGICEYFSVLADAITKYGCHVDISDPTKAVITKSKTGNAFSRHLVKKGELEVKL